MAIKVTTVVENTTFQPELQAEHGLAFHIEADGVNILFDTGQTDLLLQNALTLGIDLLEVDAVVISHGHYDHIGGLNAFLELNKRAKVVIKRRAFDDKYHGTIRYVGSALDSRLSEGRICFVEDIVELTDGVRVVPDIPIIDAGATHLKGFKVKQDGRFEQDWFEDELFMSISTPDGLVVISSCSHRGIVNIVDAAQKAFNSKVRMVLGGFHLLNALPEEVERTVAYFEQLQLEKIGVCHCTGLDAYAALKSRMPNAVYYSSVGSRLIL